MSELPRGTVPFLFTDIASSTRLWQEYPEAMRQAYARHDAILRSAITQYDGIVYKVIGDAFQVAFPTAAGALAAALEAQRALAQEEWLAFALPEPLRVRMALHVGAVDPDLDGDYRSPVLNRLGRLLGAGHGGQVLLSQAVMELVRGQLPVGAGVVDLGAHRLKDLLEPERIWQLMHPDLPSDFSPLVTLDVRPHNLPLQPTPFIGREHEIATVVDLLRRDDVRLVTLTGPGGTGKTRLSLQVASEVVEDYPDGVWFVPLAPLTDPAFVPSAISTALGVREASDSSLVDALHRYLEHRHLLLVLDNFEHLLTAAPLVSDLLVAAPRLRVLTTSRAPLRLRAEHEHPVSTLNLPRRKPPPSLAQMSQFEAVRLFVDRAVAVKPDFAVTNTSAPAVAEICHRLDGLPLAIELAAARIRMLPPQAMLARLQQRLPLLTGGARDAPARQQTLRNAIAWSYDLLSEDEQKLFRRLSVFASGWTLEAAEAVAGTTATNDLGIDVFDGLEDLVGHSLVRQQESADGTPRFGMLETMREYGLERLDEAGEAQEARERHAQHFLNQADQVGQDMLWGRSEAQWFHWFGAEYDNLRSVLEWGVEHDVVLAARLVWGLTWLWNERGPYREWQQWHRRVDRHAMELDEPLRARLALSGGTVAVRLGEWDAAEAWLPACLPVFQAAGEDELVAFTMSGLAKLGCARPGGDMRASLAMFEEELTIWQRLANPFQQAIVLSNMGVTTEWMGNKEQARDYYEQVVAMSRHLASPSSMALTLNNLGNVECGLGDYDRARLHLTECLTIAREYDLAVKLDATEGLGMCVIGTGDCYRGVMLLGAAHTARASSGDALHPEDAKLHDHFLATARAALGDEAFERAVRDGEVLSIDDAMTRALSEES